LFGDLFIRDYLFIMSLIVGVGSYGYDNIKLRGIMNDVTIGSYCSIASDVIIDGGFNHDTSFVSTYPFLNINGVGDQNIICKGDVKIGSDVWICEDVIIMSGVTIGDGAVIGAKSIVTRDVEPFSIVAGCPAREIKKRFTDEQIADLLLIKWWNWDHEKILKELPGAKDINKFIEKWKN
jgi:acetyltransferase-like isoleucine patch superfamily enzyme